MAVELRSMKTNGEKINKGFEEESNVEIQAPNKTDLDLNIIGVSTELSITPLPPSRNIVCIIRSHGYDMYKENTNLFWMTFKITLLLLYFAYFSYAMHVKFGDEGSIRLVTCTAFGVILIIVSLFRNYCIPKEFLSKITEGLPVAKGLKITRWFLYAAVSIFIIVYVIVDIAISHPENLIPLAGLAIFIFIFYITSTNPDYVNWHVVFWGMSLQFIFAVLILRTQGGYLAFKYLGDRVVELLAHAEQGAIFFFGEDFMDHYFAFGLMSTIVFISSVVSVMYYLGVMQVVVSYIGRFLAFCTGASPTESLICATNIFLAMTEGPLMIRPYVKDLTNSEIHTILTGGFATIGGSVLAAYIGFGIPANHLISASVMSAPAALAISKLTYPETEKEKVSKGICKLSPSADTNLFDAASSGAVGAIKLCGGIAVNLIAFISLLQFVNATLSWFGDRIEVKLTFELICSYLFYPISYFIGIPPNDCRSVAQLIGVKTFVNEFVAYDQMAALIRNNADLLNYTTFYNSTFFDQIGDDVFLPLANVTLVGGILTERSVVIATYAICGFANFGSMGIMLGTLGGIAPSRKKDVSQMILRSMIAGNAASFLTAGIAGLLYKDVGTL